MLKRIYSVLLIIALMISMNLSMLSEINFSATTAKQSITAEEVIKDVRVRKALSLAIDRSYIVNQVNLVRQMPASGLVPFGMKLSTGKDFRDAAGNYGIKVNQADVETAQKLLADAGFPKGEGFPELTILYNESDSHKEIAEAIQQMWVTNLGVQSKLVAQEWSDYVDSREKGSYPVIRYGWSGEYNDPLTFLEIFESGSSDNFTHWTNESYDALIDKSKYASGKKRDDILLSAEKMIMDESLAIPLYYFSKNFQIQNDVKKWYLSNNGLFYFGETIAPNGLLKWNMRYGIDTLNPFDASSENSKQIINQTFEGLMRNDATGLKPAAAKSYTISPDGTTYTFKIRDNAKWSDGKPVTAYDFEYAWKRAIDPNLASQDGYKLFCVEGAAKYYLGEGSIKDVGIKALDAKTLRVVLFEPTPQFLDLTTSSGLMPLRKDIVSKNPDSWSLNPKLAVSNGPFKLKKFTEGDRIALEPNKYWWNSKACKLKEIQAFFIDPEEAGTDQLALNAFKTGKVNLNEVFTPETIEQIAETDKTFKTITLNTNYYYMFNVK